MTTPPALREDNDAMLARAVLAFALAVLLGWGLAAVPAAAQASLTVTLDPQNNSGIDGTVTLTPVGQQTRVDIRLTGVSGVGVHPAYISAGTCASFSPTPRVTLNNVEQAVSSTIVDVPLSTFQSAPHAINIRLSATQAANVVACGNIAVTPTATPISPTATNTPMPSPTATTVPPTATAIAVPATPVLSAAPVEPTEPAAPLPKSGDLLPVEALRLAGGLAALCLLAGWRVRRGTRSG